MKLVLKDSQYIEGELKEDYYNAALYFGAVEKLDSEITNKNVEFFSLLGDKKI